jgi:radical SAM superfamily enzyme YgiQ (UPF0313 family)
MGSRCSADEVQGIWHPSQVKELPRRRQLRPGDTLPVGSRPRILLIGPYDPHCGEYTFVAPPLGVWRLAGVLESAGFHVRVFDPNCCEGSAEQALDKVVAGEPWDVIGSSTTGMTLRYDLALAHRARRLRPSALMIAGGMEATFNPGQMFELGPFDLVALGEGERPLLEIGNRLASGALDGIAGTAWPHDGDVRRVPQTALSRAELADAILRTPYEQMPYPAYWKRLESAYAVGALPSKAAREAFLAEIRSVRLITLNYCPMGCTFCSSTNFLGAALDGTARIARLDVDECLTMLRRIAGIHPTVRTVIFQDDIFVFRNDSRILPLCDAIRAAKERGDLPGDLQFISTNRIDALTPERLAAMRAAGFRVLGFGIESFSSSVLQEFNKAQIHPHIGAVLGEALRLGITPFLDLILTSPRCRLEDLAETIRQGFQWILAGCEVGMYPYVIPFAGAAMANDAALKSATVHVQRRIAGTGIRWEQPAKILPFDPEVRRAILAIESDFERDLARLQKVGCHFPSRVRSLLWVASAIPVLARAGCAVPSRDAALRALAMRLPAIAPVEERRPLSVPWRAAREPATEAV